MQTSDEDLLRRKIRRLRGFYRHLAVYLAVNGALLLINLVRSPGHLWVGWPLAGWGIAVVLHGASVFFGDRYLGSEWEQRKLDEYRRRHETEGK